jgi:hypothetical protein
MFDEIVGFANFSEYLIVAEVRHLISPELSEYDALMRVARTQYLPVQRWLALQISLDIRFLATGQFPPSMRPEQHVSLLV